MDVAIAGGHGQIAMLLSDQLTDRGDRVRGIIRDPDQAGDLADIGVEPVVLDLEETTSDELARAIDEADAVVFAAGAGPGSGAPRKETVDYGAAAKLVEAARKAGIERYVMVSSMGAADPPSEDEADDVFSVYLRAKARADQALMDSGLDWTIVRPGGLTDEPGTGAVTLGVDVERGSIPREDVATVLRHCLTDRGTVGHAFEVVSGDTPIAEALRGL